MWLLWKDAIATSYFCMKLAIPPCSDLMKVLQKIILDISTQVNVLLLSYIDLHHTLALSIKLTSLLERESERE